jgi:hypothetical protein
MHACLRQVVSLHGAAPALAACVGASFGASLAVYDTAAVKPGETARAKGVWPAHASHITALHRSGHAAALFSGAHDGSIHQCACLLLQTLLPALPPHARVMQGSHASVLRRFVLPCCRMPGHCMKPCVLAAPWHCPRP